MLDRVEKHIASNTLFTKEQKVICAVSGGVDSMVMAALLHRMGQPMLIAHFDHSLRGTASDADHEFVKSFASEHNIVFLSTKVDVGSAVLKGESTQMAARRMRYAWFDSILADREGAVLATAHHSDDAVETLLMGIVKGVGLKGLASIPLKAGRIVRPILSLRKQEILDYAKAEGISFREDKSNQDPKYLRNRIRHELVPLIADLSGNSMRPLERFVDLQRSLSFQLAYKHCFACVEEDGLCWWPRNRFVENKLALDITLRACDVHPDMIDRVYDILTQNTFGQVFHIGDNELLLERDRIVLRPSISTVNKSYSAQSVFELNADILSVREVDRKEFDLARGPEVGWFDKDQIKGAAILRPWKQGDRMNPWGMEGSKLISDMLNEASLSARKKEATYVLEVDGKILWLVGHRLANGVGIRADTEHILELQFIGQESNGKGNALETLSPDERNFTSDTK